MKLKKIFLKIFVFSNLLSFAFSNELSGEWENFTRKIYFDSESERIQINLRPYFSKHTDKAYYKSFSQIENAIFVTSGELYLNFYCEDEGLKNFFVPQNNFFEISLDEKKLLQNLYAYYFLDSEKKNALKIRYWKCSADFYDEGAKAYLQYDGENLEINKFIKINECYYVCTVGKGVNIRNFDVISFENEFKSTKFFTEGKIFRLNDCESENAKSVFVVGKPYLTQVPKS